jgi:hypothetical protein
VAFSEELQKLTDRALRAQQDARDAESKARVDVEQRMSEVETSADADATELRAKAEEGRTGTSSTWTHMSESWDVHVTKVRADVARRKSRHEASSAASRANDAAYDAEFAIAVASTAIEEAGRAVLDAILARREADEAAKAAPLP